MCKHCYKKFLERSNKIMLFCKLLEENNDSKNEMTKLCIRQRFCDEKDEYIKCINLACKPKEYNPDIIPLRKFYYYKLCDSIVKLDVISKKNVSEIKNIGRK